MKKYVKNISDFLLESLKAETKKEAIKEIIDMIDDIEISSSLESYLSDKSISFINGFSDGFSLGIYKENENIIKDNIEKSKDIEYNTGMMEGFAKRNEMPNLDNNDIDEID